MVAQLEQNEMQMVVEGLFGRSRGLVGCSFEVRPNSYVWDGQPKVKLPVWDFVLRREDGTGIRLHPSWTKPKVESYNIEGHAEPVEPPRPDMGRSDGKGTFRKYKHLGNKQYLRFGKRNRT